MSEIAHASLSLFWDDRRKRWSIIARWQGGRTITMAAESTAPIDDVDVWRMAHDLKRSLEARLPL